MKALLLAGGKGTRLRPLTDNIPKPMVPVMGKPLLESTIMNLKKNGITEIIISTCYKSNYIKDYFKDGSEFGVRIKYISEDIPLGTGGAIKNVQRYVDDAFIIFNSDILSDINIKRLIDFHKSRKADATIAVTHVENPSQYGVIEYDDNKRIKSFKEKPKGKEITSHFINAGIYIFEPKVLKEIPANKVVSIEKDTYPSLLQKGYNLYAYESNDYWMDIGNLSKYLRCHKDIMDGKCKLISSNMEKFCYDGNIILPYENNRISSKAKIVGPCYIGKNVSIDDGALIGPYACIGDNSIVMRESRIAESILWNGVKVRNRAKLLRTVVTFNCTIDNDKKICNAAYAKDEDVAI